MHHAGAVLGGDLVARDDPPGVLRPEGVGVGEVVEQRLVAAAEQILSSERVQLSRAAELLLVGGQAVLGEDVPLAVLRFHGHVRDVGADRDGQVRRQRPRRGGPGEDPLAGLQLEPHGDGRVRPVGVDVVVHPQLVVGQRGLAPPAVGQHLEALVDQALVVQLLERPHDALHVGEVERLVVVFEVDPAGLPGDVLLPLLGVAEHGVAARLVEGLDAHLEDVGLAGDAKQSFGLDLGGQPVAVPAEPSVHLVAAHGLVTRHDVLDVAGQQVAVVGEAVGERRAVVEDELAVAVPVLDRRLERVVRVPVGERPLLKLGKVRLGGYFGRARARVGGHFLLGLSVSLRVRPWTRAARTTRPLPCGPTAVPPRLPPCSLALPLALRFGLCLGLGGRSLAGCDGPDPPGSTGAACLFFRGLTGDGRVIALLLLSLRVGPTAGCPNIFRGLP